MDIEALAKKAGMITELRSGAASCVWTEGLTAVSADQLIEFANLVAAEVRHDCEIAVWLVRQEATNPDAPDHGLDGWLQEAEGRIRVAVRSTAGLGRIYGDDI